MSARAPAVALLLATLLSASAAAATGLLEIDPAVLSVSSGPWVWASGNYHFRAITVRDGGLVSLHVQKIELDPKSEELSVVKNFAVDLDAVAAAAYEIDGIRWSGADGFVFRVNSTLYSIRNLDGEPEVRLAGPAR